MSNREIYNGQLLEEGFDSLGVRYIAIMGNIDTAICFRDCSTVPIAVRNCTTAPATVLKPDKTTLFAPLPVKRVRRSVTPTSSEPLYWKKVRSST